MELLVVIAILGVLIALAAGTVSSMRQRGDRAVATGNMRQIGVGISLYTAENNKLLPGPLWPGQIPVANSERPGRLVDYLAPYLGVDTDAAPSPLALFIPPAYLKAAPDIPIHDARTYVINTALAMDAGEEGAVAPFGNLAAGNKSVLSRLQIPNGAWALSDADQLHPRVAAAPWATNTPPRPVHGNLRLVLRFSGAVVELDLDDPELAQP